MKYANHPPRKNHKPEDIRLAVPVTLNTPKRAASTAHTFSPSPVTRKLARERAVKLAAINGRSAHDVSKADWEQAKRDLKGEPDTDTKEVSRGSTSNSVRWDPLPNSIGYKVHVPSGDDEDDEGRSDTERLVEKGGREAALDQMRQADREGELID